MHKITRISFNSTGWRRPTAEARQTEATNTYNQKFGFGHEDWLFRSEWQIDGWRYAFLQGINKSHTRLVANGSPLDITLFTITPASTRQYVATIKDVECLDDRQAQDALKEFKQRGWYAAMQSEIKKVGGDASQLGNWPGAKYILNIRFREANVFRDEPSEPIEAWINHLNRYQLYDFPLADAALAKTTSRRRSAATGSLNVAAFLRRGTGETECTPEHARMQLKLIAELQREYPGATIAREEEFVDVSVRTATEVLFFEIKSDLNPRTVIRLALGQLLEYGFHPSRSATVSVTLIIVGRNELPADEKTYLERLQTQFNLPLRYRQVSI